MCQPTHFGTPRSDADEATRMLASAGHFHLSRKFAPEFAVHRYGLHRNRVYGGLILDNYQGGYGCRQGDVAFS